jgi:hypothetical protein
LLADATNVVMEYTWTSVAPGAMFATPSRKILDHKWHPDSTEKCHTNDIHWQWYLVFWDTAENILGKWNLVKLRSGFLFNQLVRSEKQNRPTALSGKKTYVKWLGPVSRHDRII